MQQIINGLKILFTDPERLYIYFKNRFTWNLVTYFANKYTLSIVYEHILGFEIFLSGKNNIVEQEVVLKGGFEDYLVDFYKNNLDDTSVMMDIGCNFGLFSLLGGSIIKKGKIYSFDADINMTNLLNKSVRLNQFTNIQIVNIAISDKNGFIDFNIVDDPAYNSIGKVEGHGICQSIQLAAITLDSFIEQNSITKIDFVKMDIEGAELSALKGGENLLKNLKPVLSIEVGEKNFSYFNYKSTDLIKYMQDLGYKVYNYKNSQLVEEVVKDEYIYDNLIFIHKDNTKIFV